MDILLSNDDGVYAPGLKSLHKALSELGNVFVIAPDRDLSAVSKSLTLTSPIRAKQLDNGFFSIEGTPTDCVHLGLTNLIDKKPNLVVAGINDGANLGDDVLYSGTVAAATEGHFFGIPSIAVSLVGNATTENYDKAAKVVIEIINNIDRALLSPTTILNVNVPPGDVKGIKITRFGQRHRSQAMVKTKDPRGKEIYWIGPPSPEQDAGPGTDFHAINEGYVSITPMQMDLTNHNLITDLHAWAAELKI